MNFITKDFKYKQADVVYKIKEKGNKRMDNEGCLIALLAVILVAAMLFLIPWLELWLWGMVMIPVFGAPALTYW